jgi:HlyD family secretion protein
VKVPVGALFREGAGWAAFVFDGERAHKRAVKLVWRNNLEAMIEAGVSPGDRVVVYPSDARKDGSRVQITSPR